MNKKDPEMKKMTQNTKKLIYNSNAFLIVFIVVVLAVIVNLLVARLDVRLDTTKTKMYSLSEQTLQALKELNKQNNDLMVIGFYRNGDPNKDMVEDLLKQYQKRSSRIDFRFVDPYKKPAEAKQYQIQELGTLVVTMAGKDMKLFPRDIFEQSYGGPGSFAGERALTRTIYQMIDAETKNIYLLQGHGEKEYGQAKTYIESQGYGVKTLNLMKDGQIPADCSELIIAGPQGDLSSQEMKVIEDYSAQGGRLMIFLDYPPEKARISNLVAFVQKWGVDVENSIVVETERHTMFDYTSVVPNYVSHEIVNKLQQSNIAVLFPANRGLKKVTNSEGAAEPGANVSVILESSAKSWAETNPRGQVKMDNSETKGPIPLAMAVTKSINGKESRLIVTGTSSFLDNESVSQAGNLNLFINMSQWLLGQEDRITITPKQMDITRVTLNPIQGNIIRWFALFIFPAIIVITGGVIWFRRRAR